MIIAFTKTIYAAYSRALLPLFIYKMENVNFKYLIKNIPIPSERAYLLQLMEKIEILLQECVGERSIVTAKQMINQVKGMV